MCTATHTDAIFAVTLGSDLIQTLIHSVWFYDFQLTFIEDDVEDGFA